MSKIDELIDTIKTQGIGASGKSVLLVEGVDDVDAISAFLRRRAPGWETSWLIEAAEGKKQVLQILAKEPHWLGLVDRDEWSSAEIASYTGSHPNLLILPRFCIESYLVNPAELWQALPMVQQAKVGGGQVQLANELAQYKANWLRHAALWHVINPLWGQLRSAGFKDSVLDPQHVPTDPDLLQRLNQWKATVDPTTIMQSVQQAVSALQGKTEDEFYSQWLYAKAFYPQVVLRTLNKILAINMSAKDWRSNLFSSLPVPNDLDPVWTRMRL